MNSTGSDPATATLQRVRDMLGETLNLGERAATLEPHTELFGSLPELDSMALVMLVMDIEQRFGFMLDDEDVTAENFATVGDLIQLIESKGPETA